MEAFPPMPYGGQGGFDDGFHHWQLVFLHILIIYCIFLKGPFRKSTFWYSGLQYFHPIFFVFVVKVIKSWVQSFPSLKSSFFGRKSDQIGINFFRPTSPGCSFADVGGPQIWKVSRRARVLLTLQGTRKPTVDGSQNPAPPRMMILSHYL